MMMRSIVHITVVQRMVIYIEMAKEKNKNKAQYSAHIEMSI